MAWDKIPGGSDLLRVLGPEPNFGDSAIVSFSMASETCRLLVETVASSALPSVRIAFDMTGLISLSLEKTDAPDVLDELLVRLVPGPTVVDVTDASWRTSSRIELTVSSLAGLRGSVTASAMSVSITSIDTER